MDKRELKLSVTNCYLIEMGNKYLLIDTGYENEWGLFCKRLKEVGVGLYEISHIMLTHHHDDHCGLLNKMLEENPDIQIIMSYRAKEYLLTGKNDNTHGGCYVNKRVNLFGSLIKIFDKRLMTHAFPPYQSRVMDILVKGETYFKEIGIELNGRIIETPGHTLDSISILFDDGDCVVGDAAANFPRFLGTKYCVVIIDDLEAYYKSWRKLISEGARQIFPAHGKPFPAEKLEQNIDKNSRKHMVMIS
jgi:glyoxylase-like metal-dependent hydrolase (beta-lactamase superfamily II)